MTEDTQSPPQWTAPDPPPGAFQTPRLIVRKPEHRDAEAMFDAIESSRDTLLPWLPWARFENRSVAECHYTIERFSRSHVAGGDPEYGYLFGVCDRPSDRLIGGAGFARIRPAVHEAEVGYWMRADRRGEGLITEATGRLISSLLTPKDQDGWGLRRIVILCAAPNTASARVPTKLGMAPELHCHADRWVDGYGWTDSLGWGTNGDQWDFTRHRARAAD